MLFDERVAGSRDGGPPVAVPFDRRRNGRGPAQEIYYIHSLPDIPGARVIWCRRDPMDTGLSCFQQNFRSEGMDFARDLGHIGLYQQGCRRLMEHWQRHLSLPIHAVDYERVIEDPEGQVRALLAFAGLDWHEACLDFHRSGRLVRTASYEQVRRPIYGTSIGRWRHYEPWLGPLAAALATPWLSSDDRPDP